MIGLYWLKDMAIHREVNDETDMLRECIVKRGGCTSIGCEEQRGTVQAAFYASFFPPFLTYYGRINFVGICIVNL